MKYLILIFTLTAFLSQSAYARLSATVGRTEITQGDIIQLIIELDQQASGDPDFSVLEQDFEFDYPSRSSQISIINGRTSATTRWILELMPKRYGNLIIPAIKFNGQTSQPISLTVKPIGESREDKVNAQRPVFVTLEVDNEHPYVQEQIMLHLKIHHSEELVGGKIGDLQPDQAIVSRLDDKTQYSTLLGNTRYNVIEIHYVLSPQQSGPLTIPSVTFQGEISTGPRRGFLSPFGGTDTQRVYDATTPVTLTVKPKPASWPSGVPWLPAKSLKLSESWNPETTVFTVGEAVTRTISIQIEGQSAKLIPDLTPSESNGFKIYSDHAQIDDQLSPQGVSGKKTESFALVPVNASPALLPPVQVRWWNTLKNQLEITELKARKITVNPGQQAVSPLPRSMDTATPQTPRRQETLASSEASSDAGSSERQPVWQMLTWIFALLWLLTLTCLIWLLKNRTSMKSKTRVKPVTKPAPSLNQLKKASATQDPKTIADAILGWAQAFWPDRKILSLGDIKAAANDPDLTQALADLEQKLYNATNNSGHWQAGRIYTMIETLARTQNTNRKNSKDPELVPLYPI